MKIMRLTRTTTAATAIKATNKILNKQKMAKQWTDAPPPPQQEQQGSGGWHGPASHARSQPQRETCGD